MQPQNNDWDQPQDQPNNNTPPTFEPNLQPSEAVRQPMPQNNMPYTTINPSLETDRSFDQSTSSAPANFNQTPTPPAGNPQFSEQQTFASQPQPMPDYVAPAPVAPVKKSRKKLWIILGSILAALLIALAAGWYAFAFVYNKPENALMDGMAKLLSAEALQTSTTLTAQYEVTGAMAVPKLKQVKYNYDANRNPNAMTNVEVSLEYQGKDYTIGGSGMLVDSGDIYFKIAPTGDTASSIYKSLSGESLPNSVVSKIKDLEDKWVKVSRDDIKSYSPEADKVYGCVLDTYKKYKDDKNVQNEMAKVYEANQFIKIEGKPQVKGMLNGYNVTIDKDKFKAFTKAGEETTAAKELKKCDSSSQSSSSTDYSGLTTTESSSLSDVTPTATIWVNQFSHVIEKVDFKVEDKSSSSPYTIDSTTALTYDKNKKIDAPSEAMSVKEFGEKAASLYQEVSSMTSSSYLNKSAETTGSETAAYTVWMKAEAYGAINGHYPDKVANFNDNEESSLDALTQYSVKDDVLPQDSKTIGYKLCSSGSAQVIYQDASTKKYMAIDIGSGKTGEVTKFC